VPDDPPSALVAGGNSDLGLQLRGLSMRPIRLILFGIAMTSAQPMR